MLKDMFNHHKTWENFKWKFALYMSAKCTSAHDNICYVFNTESLEGAKKA